MSKRSSQLLQHKRGVQQGGKNRRQVSKHLQLDRYNYFFIYFIYVVLLIRFINNNIIIFFNNSPLTTVLCTGIGNLIYLEKSDSITPNRPNCVRSIQISECVSACSYASIYYSKILPFASYGKPASRISYFPQLGFQKFHCSLVTYIFKCLRFYRNTFFLVFDNIHAYSGRSE